MSDTDKLYNPYQDTIKSLNVNTCVRDALRFYDEGINTDDVDVELSAFTQANVSVSLALLSEVHALRIVMENTAGNP